MLSPASLSVVLWAQVQPSDCAGLCPCEPQAGPSLVLDLMAKDLLFTQPVVAQCGARLHLMSLGQGSYLCLQKGAGL